MQALFTGHSARRGFEHAKVLQEDGEDGDEGCGYAILDAAKQYEKRGFATFARIAVQAARYFSDRVKDPRDAG